MTEPHLDPTHALRSIEIALRLAIREALGNTWFNCGGAPSRQSLEDKREAERRRRDGAITSSDLLDYAETHHLTSIILKNWQDHFKEVFDDKKRTEVYFGVIQGVRNSIAHSRDLVPFEKSLITGISGHVRNQVSIYRSSKVRPDASYYPLIESLTDNFGLLAYREHEQIDGDNSNVGPRLDVGQTMVFTGRAFNSRGVNIRWTLHRQRIQSAMIEDVPPLAHADGDDATLTYTLTEDDVREHYHLSVRIVADQRFHRHTGRGEAPYDDEVELYYKAINPPL